MWHNQILISLSTHLKGLFRKMCCYWITLTKCQIVIYFAAVQKMCTHSSDKKLCREPPPASPISITNRLTFFASIKFEKAAAILEFAVLVFVNPIILRNCAPSSLASFCSARLLKKLLSVDSRLFWNESFVFVRCMSPRWNDPHPTTLLPFAVLETYLVKQSLLAKLLSFRKINLSKAPSN